MGERPARPPGREVSAVAVVIPVHDEEVLLPRCLSALETAVSRLRQARPNLRIEVLLVLDACTDGTAAVAARHTVHVRTIDSRCVGLARAAGTAAAGALLGVGADRSPSAAWLASTDADSMVPPDWLTDQISAAAGGADLVLGRVRPDPEDLEAGLRRAWLREHCDTDPTRHVHGANLGVRWDALEAAGGFKPVVEHEDVLLVQAVLSHGAQVVPGREVLTSGRRRGRVPGGFSGYLRRLARNTALPPLVDSD